MCIITRKRLLAAFVSMVLALSCASTVFASPSPSLVMEGAFDSAMTISATTQVGNRSVSVSKVDTSKVGITGISGKDDASVKAILFTGLKKTTGVSNNKIISIFECSYDNLDEDVGTDIVFYVDGVKASDVIQCLTWNSNNL